LACWYGICSVSFIIRKWHRVFFMKASSQNQIRRKSKKPKSIVTRRAPSSETISAKYREVLQLRQRLLEIETSQAGRK